MHGLIPKGRVRTLEHVVLPSGERWTVARESFTAIEIEEARLSLRKDGRILSTQWIFNRVPMPGTEGYAVAQTLEGGERISEIWVVWAPEMAAAIWNGLHRRMPAPDGGPTRPSSLPWAAELRLNSGERMRPERREQVFAEVAKFAQLAAWAILPPNL